MTDGLPGFTGLLIRDLGPSYLHSGPRGEHVLSLASKAPCEPHMTLIPHLWPQQVVLPTVPWAH